MRRTSSYLDDDILVGRIANTARDDDTISAHHTADDELTDTHANRAVDEKGSSTGFVDEEEDNGGEYDEECVLHARGDEVDVAFKTSHLKDIDDVVGHHICTGHLLPCSVYN